MPRVYSLSGHCGENPKFEYRNSKQIPMTEFLMTKTSYLSSRTSLFLDFDYSEFDIVSDFEF